MDDIRKDFMSNFDWKSFEQFFGGKFPLAQSELNKNTAWVDQVVKDVMTKAFPQVDASKLGALYQTEVFETHNNVIVKIRIPDREQARSISVFAAMNHVKLDGGDSGKKQTIRLSSPVVPESCKAVYKGGVMQLHMKKWKRKKPPHEVYVRFLD